MFKFLNDKRFWRNAFKLAFPVAVQNMLFSSFTLIDTLLVSTLGDVTLAAVGMAGQWSWLMNMIFFGTCSATGVFVAQYWGVKDEERIHKTLGIALSITLFVSFVFFLLSFFLPSQVIGMFNKEQAVISEGGRYLKILALCFPALALSNVFSVVLRSTEKPNLPMFVSLATTLLNIFLDYSLILGKFGMPALGAEGAAIATVIACWLGVVFIVAASLVKRNILISSFKQVFGYKSEDLKVFFKRAIPVIANESLWGAGVFIFNLIYSNMGYEYYASITILKTFENLSYVLFIGMCSACSVMVGKSVGMGEIDRGIKDSKRFLIIIPFVAVFMGAIAIIFRVQLVSIFDLGNNISELTINTARLLIIIYSVELPVRTLGFTFVVGILRSGGDTLTAAKFDLGSMWIFSLPATLIAAYVFKLPFIACYIVMYLFEDYIKIFFCANYYRKLKWIKPVTEEGKAALKEFTENG